jgi:hypothetical protein
MVHEERKKTKRHNEGKREKIKIIERQKKDGCTEIGIDKDYRKTEKKHIH